MRIKKGLTVLGEHRVHKVKGYKFHFVNGINSIVLE